MTCLYEKYMKLRLSIGNVPSKIQLGIEWKATSKVWEHSIKTAHFIEKAKYTQKKTYQLGKNFNVKISVYS